MYNTSPFHLSILQVTAPCNTSAGDFRAICPELMQGIRHPSKRKRAAFDGAGSLEKPRGAVEGGPRRDPSALAGQSVRSKSNVLDPPSVTSARRPEASGVKYFWGIKGSPVPCMSSSRTLPALLAGIGLSGPRETIETL